MVATIGYRFLEYTTAQLSVGSILAGQLDTAGVKYDVHPGFVTSLSLSQNWLGDRKTFLVTTFTAGVSTTTTDSPSGSDARLTATDFRGSLVLGYTFAEMVSPFLLVRGFGGPVRWDPNGSTVTGGDQDHYAFGAGVILRKDDWNFSISGSALGERSVSAGLAYAF